MNGNNQKNLPEKKFSAGGIVASVWSNMRTVNGQQRELKSVSIERRYKDADGEWKSSASFSVNQLPLAKFVLDQAYEYILTARQQANDPGVEEEDMTDLRSERR
jgi:hypothetical protein